MSIRTIRSTSASLWSNLPHGRKQSIKIFAHHPSPPPQSGGNKIIILRIKIRITINAIGLSSTEFNVTKFHREVISPGGFLKSSVRIVMRLMLNSMVSNKSEAMGMKRAFIFTYLRQTGLIVVNPLWLRLTILGFVYDGRSLLLEAFLVKRCGLQHVRAS